MNDQQRAVMQMAYETLERLSCVKQTMHLLWWQIEARKPLSVLREALAQPIVKESLTAQKQGEWVDLTDDEIDELSRTMVKGYKSVNWLSYSIITKFKEKNTPPSVEAAIEATKEKAAKVCDGYAANSSHPMNFAENCAAAIRSMK